MALLSPNDSGIEKVVDEEHRNTQLLANQPNLSVRIQMLKNENTLLDNNVIQLAIPPNRTD
eukprot:Awhi_evm1s11816